MFDTAVQSAVQCSASAGTAGESSHSVAVMVALYMIASTTVVVWHST